VLLFNPSTGRYFPSKFITATDFIYVSIVANRWGEDIALTVIELGGA
jgi:hypothetical protein